MQSQIQTQGKAHILHLPPPKQPFTASLWNLKEVPPTPASHRGPLSGSYASLFHTIYMFPFPTWLQSFGGLSEHDGLQANPLLPNTSLSPCLSMLPPVTGAGPTPNYHVLHECNAVCNYV